MKTSEKLNHLANFLDALPEGRFNFGEWGNGCGTVCCAAGHIAEAFPNDAEAQKTWIKTPYSFQEFDHEQAEDFLGVDKAPKCRKSDKCIWGYTDFERMFRDEDFRLRPEDHMSMHYVPKSAVTARLRRMAAHYAKMGR